MGKSFYADIKKNGMQLFSMVNFAYTSINWWGGEIIWKMQLYEKGL